MRFDLGQEGTPHPVDPGGRFGHNAQAMKGLLAPVSALLIGVSILLMGHGLQGVLIPVRADMEAFPRIVIGLLASAYFAGLMFGCLACPRVISRVGHVRAFVAFTAIATVVPLAHAAWLAPGFWLTLRFVLGACFAGLTMVIESWLNGSCTNATRGRVLALYTVINLTVVVIGQQLLNAADPGSFRLFSLVAIFVSLAAVPVALTRTPAPAPPRAARLRVRWLYSISPVGVAGCFVAGLAGGAFWGLAPIFARSSGLALPDVALFMSAVVLGGALAQWPAGRWSDRTDRRLVIAIASLGASAAGGALVASHAAPEGSLFGFALLYGMTALSIYSVSLAHANDLVAKDESVDVSSGLLLVYAIGAVAGPFLASLLMALTAPAFLFAFTAAAHGFLGIVALYRMRRRAAPPPESRGEFVAVPRTSPAVFGLDPRGAGSARREGTEEPG